MRTFLIAAALVASVATRATAQAVVYDNGGPNQASGNEMSDWIQAENFTFGSSATFNQIRFWDIEAPPGYSGNGISWWIFTNDGLGNPGAILYNGTATPTRQATGNSLGGYGTYVEFQNDLSIGSLTLGPGSYWLGLHEGNDYAYRSFGWETTNPTAGNGHESAGGTMDNWQDNEAEHAFELLNTNTSSVPEPASTALLVTGLVGILGIATRRRGLPRI
jgi:hypothetical protein